MGVLKKGNFYLLLFFLLFSITACKLSEVVVSPTNTPMPEPTNTAVFSRTPSPEPTDVSLPTSTPTLIAQPDISLPRAIAYTKIAGANDELHIFIYYDLEEPIETKITEDGNYILPTWSPSNEQLAFLKLNATFGTVDFIIHDIATSTNRQLTDLDFDLFDIAEFNWSADEKYLIYTAPQPNGSKLDIYKIDVQTGDIENLTADSPFWDNSASEASDGSSIVFATGRSGSNNIWLMNPDGSKPRQLTTSSAQWENARPVWSPDSSKIAFFRFTNEDISEKGTSGLWLSDLEGNEQLLVEIESAELFNDQKPVWSPNGRFIAYQHGVKRGADIYVVPVTGGEPINVSNMFEEDLEPSWLPNSSALIFTHQTENKIQIYINSLEGGKAELLFSEFLTTLYGKWSRPASETGISIPTNTPEPTATPSTSNETTSSPPRFLAYTKLIDDELHIFAGNG